MVKIKLSLNKIGTSFFSLDYNIIYCRDLIYTSCAGHQIRVTVYTTIGAIDILPKYENSSTQSGIL